MGFFTEVLVVGAMGCMGVALLLCLAGNVRYNLDCRYWVNGQEVTDKLPHRFGPFTAQQCSEERDTKLYVFTHTMYTGSPMYNPIATFTCHVQEPQK